MWLFLRKWINGNSSSDRVKGREEKAREEKARADDSNDSNARMGSENFTRVQAGFGTDSVRTRYAHPEFAYSIMNLMYIRAAVAKNQAAPLRCFQITTR